MDFIEQFKSEGWLRIDQIFDRQLIDLLREETEAQSTAFLAAGEKEREYLRVGDNRVMLSVRMQNGFLDPGLFAHPIILNLLGQFLGSDLVIDSLTCVTALPGAGAQHEHNDHSQLFPADPGMEARLGCYAVTLVVPLVDLTEATGTTRLLPGTHIGRDALEHVDPYLRRGDCFLMDYRLRHQGLANRSAEQRPVLFIVYARSWFTDSCNFHRQPRINLGREGLEQLKPDHRRLFRRLAGHGTSHLAEPALAGEKTSCG